MLGDTAEVVLLVGLAVLVIVVVETRWVPVAAWVWTAFWVLVLAPVLPQAASTTATASAAAIRCGTEDRMATVWPINETIHAIGVSPWRRCATPMPPEPSGPGADATSIVS